MTSHELLDFTLARFVRFRLQGMHTMRTSSNIPWLVDREALLKRSFYALRHIKIGARLDCNGHANEAKNFNSENLIECNCAHNTCGPNCEKCCPLFNQRPYKSATAAEANECEKCEVWTVFTLDFDVFQIKSIKIFFHRPFFHLLFQCNGHSIECYYNPEVDQRHLSLNTFGVYSGGGVCLNCTAFTTGINCEQCIENYYRPYGVGADAEIPCIQCDCSPIGSLGVCSSDGGVCECREGFTGRKCDECALGYSGNDCKKCACNIRGTMPGGECENHCQCKVNFQFFLSTSFFV